MDNPDRVLEIPHIGGHVRYELKEIPGSAHVNYEKWVNTSDSDGFEMVAAGELRNWPHISKEEGGDADGE